MATHDFFAIDGYQAADGCVMRRHSVICEPGYWRVSMLTPRGAGYFFTLETMKELTLGRSAFVDDFGTLVPVEVH